MVVLRMRKPVFAVWQAAPAPLARTTEIVPHPPIAFYTQRPSKSRPYRAEEFSAEEAT